MKVVKMQSGFFDEGSEAIKGQGYLEKEIMMCYPGKFMSMDGEVEITLEMLQNLSSNFNSLTSKMKRALVGGVPVIDQRPLKDCPPFQLDHEVKATHTIGRFVGPTYLREVEIDDKPTMALFGRARIMGQDNMEKVEDGRWIHVSIGADLDKGILNELSITPFPAAPHASMLCRLGAKEEHYYKGFKIEIHTDAGGNRIATVGKEAFTEKEGGDVLEKAKEYIDGLIKKNNLSANQETKESTLTTETQEGAAMSYKDAKALMEKYEKCRKHLQTKCAEDTDDQREEKLSALSAEDVDKMAAEHDEEEKKLAANPPEEDPKEKEAKMARLARIQKAKDETAKVELAFANVKKQEKKARLSVRLAALRHGQKITPAEIKKMDLDEMASMGDEALNAVMKSFEIRQPVIDARVHGTVQALTAAELSKSLRFSSKEAEVKARMSSHKTKDQKDAELSGKRLSETSEEEHEAARIRDQVAHDRENTGMSDEHFSKLSEIHESMKAGKHEEALSKMGDFLSKCRMGSDSPADIGAESAADTEKHLAALAEASQALETILTSTRLAMAELEK